MRHLLIIHSLCLILAGTSCYGQNNYPLWKTIHPGNYNVGYKVVEYIDVSRTINPKYDEAGQINPDRFLPIQISVWYPTGENWAGDSSLKFKDYFWFSLIIQDFGHAYLTGNLIALPDLPESDMEKHELWFSCVKEFFDTHLKNGKDNFTSMWESLDANPLLFRKKHKQKKN